MALKLNMSKTEPVFVPFFIPLSVSIPHHPQWSIGTTSHSVISTRNLSVIPDNSFIISHIHFITTPNYPNSKIHLEFVSVSSSSLLPSHSKPTYLLTAFQLCSLYPVKPHHLKRRSYCIILLKTLQRLCTTLRIKFILFNMPRVTIELSKPGHFFKSEKGIINNYIRTISLNQAVTQTPAIWSP